MYAVAPNTQSPNFPMAPLDVAPFHPTTTCDPPSVQHYATSSIAMDMGIPNSDPATWLSSADPTAILDFPEFADLAEFAQSQPSSAYSGSPTHSDVSLPVAAPQPQPLQEHAGLSFEAWQDGMAQMHMKQGAPTPMSLSDMESQLGASLDGLFGGSFGVEASSGHGGGLALGFDYPL